jgi:hypothetical protein
MRWGSLGALIAGVVIAAFAISRTQPKAQTIGADEAPVLAADIALGDAGRAGDKLTARKLLALQFTLVDVDGRIYARRDFLDDLKNTADAPASDVKVRSYGLLAAVTGRRKSAQNADVFFLDIWARQKGAWRALLRQEVATAAGDTPAAIASAPAPAVDAPPYECRNPCQTLPYRVRSLPEQDVIAAFQAIEKAIVAHDASEWSKHAAEEFVIYRSGHAPAGKSDRIAAIEWQKAANTPVTVAEVQSMRLAVYGDAAAMVTNHLMPDNSRPPYRAARLWVRRNGQWLMAISAQTDIK